MECYSIPEDLPLGALHDEISRKYRAVSGEIERKTLSYYDTFDWRLHKDGLALCKRGSVFDLFRPGEDDAPVCSSREKRRKSEFWWEFSGDELRDCLAKRIESRALQCLIRVEEETRRLRILNRDAKTVLYVDLVSLHIHPDRDRVVGLNLATIVPVRGYLREHKRFQAFLTGLGPSRRTDSALALALEAAGIEPGAYSPKLNLRLRPDMSTLEATGIVMRHLLKVMRQNEAGIRDDIDSEFLHDYRVSVRRTRSALTQIKGAFPDKDTAQWKGFFAHLGKQSNLLRDLDVYVLNEAAYAAMLPDHLRDGLKPFFRRLASRRRREHRKFVEFLDSDECRNGLDKWETFLEIDPARLTGAQGVAREPVIDPACRYIAKRHARVMKLGDRITDDTPDQQLHDLRIECKKLRYLLEIFSSLFAADKLGGLIKQLKVLQENLGDFNDLCVQQGNLHANIQARRGDPWEVAAVGGLIARLHGRQLAVRASFGEAYRAFGRPKIRTLFHELFYSTGTEGKSG